MFDATARATITLELPIDAAFDAVTRAHLPSILKGYAFLPAVTGVEEQTGDWNAPGQTRTIRLADGSSVFEQIDEIDHPRRFAYRIGRFTSPLRFLSSGARGEFLFESRGAARTEVCWIYRYEATSPVAAPLVALIIRVFWRRCMERALAAIPG